MQEVYSMEKTYVNKNMIRTKHNVGRMIYFESELERERFIKLYGDMFDRYGCGESNGRISLYITIPLKCFNEIVKALGLINVKMYGHKTKYWRTEGALV